MIRRIVWRVQEIEKLWTKQQLGPPCGSSMISTSYTVLSKIIARLYVCVLSNQEPQRLVPQLYRRHWLHGFTCIQSLQMETGIFNLAKQLRCFSHQV